jgi:hypothetical protein
MTPELTLRSDPVTVTMPSPGQAGKMSNPVTVKRIASISVGLAWIGLGICLDIFAGFSGWPFLAGVLMTMGILTIANQFRRQ